MCPIRIEQVKDIMEQNLPECWLPLEACLSTMGAAMLEDVDHCIGLILVGQPGGRKTTTIGLLGTEAPFYKLDTFTPASFVSHDASKKEATLQKIDLLPKIKHRIMVIPELSPLLTQRYEDLMKDIGILTAVMDGAGFQSASGTHGTRGYEGDYRFGMVASTVPLEHRVWQALGRLSSRWIFYRLGEAEGEGFDLRADLISKKEVCKAVVQPFIKDLWKGFASVTWNRAGDAKSLTDLLTFSARLICKWRGIIPRQDSAGYNPALVEVPYRLAETLYALARGHALIWGRDQIDKKDTYFAMEANYGNMPEDRVRLDRAFVQKAWDNRYEFTKWEDYFSITLNVSEAAGAIGCASSTAKDILNELIGLGVIEYDTEKRAYRKVI